MKFIALGLALLMGVGEAIGEESVPAKAAAEGYLIVDYLPPAIYDGDELTACFRVENPLKSKTSFQFNGAALDKAGKDVKRQTQKVEFGASEFSPVTMRFDIQRATSFLFELNSTKVIGSTRVKLIREGEPWPACKVEHGRLTTDDGAVLIPVVQKKRVLEERAFAPLDWIFGSNKTDGTARPGKTVLFAPGGWKLKQAGLIPLGPFSADGSPPILRAMDAILSALNSPAKPADPGAALRVVIVLPPEDLELATEPRAYRVVLDALLERLVRAGATRIVLAAPFKFGCNETHRTALWHEAAGSAALYGAKSLNPSAWMEEAAWQADPGAAGVFAPVPNDSGKKMIEQALADLIQ